MLDLEDAIARLDDAEPVALLLNDGKGRIFQLEFVTGAGTAHGFGIGKDNEENIYRFLF